MTNSQNQKPDANPLFGRMNDPTASASIKGPCGDEMEFYLEIRDGRIGDIRYYMDGCGHTRMCGAAVARRAKGRTVMEALDITVRVRSLMLSVDDPARRETILRRLPHEIANAEWIGSPPAMGQRIHRIIRQELGCRDPYRDVKDRLNRMAEELLPSLCASMARQPWWSAGEVLWNEGLLDSPRQWQRGNRQDHGRGESCGDPFRSGPERSASWRPATRGRSPSGRDGSTWANRCPRH